MYKDDVMVMIMAGGEGKRLYPLTKDRAKPAVPFGGRYRIIDFVMNNFINSGFYKIKILTQFKSDSLNKHITRTWPASPITGHYIDLVPAQMRTGAEWYKGTADAIYQNKNLITDEEPKYVFVFGGDHIYKMDVKHMLKYHRKKSADLTISAIPVPVEMASEFGIMVINEDWKLIGFQEKPKHNPATIPGQPDMVLASMGNYIFNKDILLEELITDAENKDSGHDFGHDIIPNMYDKLNVYVYDFSRNIIKGMTESEKGYWKDVGSIDAYWQANMDLLAPLPEFDLYSQEWPIRTENRSLPPAKFVWKEGERTGMATNSLVSEGCVISGGQIDRCVLSFSVRINSFAHVEESLLFENVNIGRYSKIRKSIIDKGVFIPPYTEVGYNKEEDLERGFYVTDSGITIVPKGATL
ncbi:MAG: glucose-1-phosphate adenylyltransferase [Candidatus Melainabacteria bacterium GWF2_37_15]|nr:MAG: glucose-1-phosphate adenylyltransferase [Candidatus Melainabacteria bacterium GWF2_37_15]